MKLPTTLIAMLLCVCVVAQPNRWQQAVKYNMTVDVDTQLNRFAGKQLLEYTNNSDDVLNKVFYHL